jgi:hypothetical protein
MSHPVLLPLRLSEGSAPSPCIRPLGKTLGNRAEDQPKCIVTSVYLFAWQAEHCRIKSNQLYVQIVFICMLEPTIRHP